MTERGARFLRCLSPFQVRIAVAVAEGLGNKAIAQQVNTTEQVVKNYLHLVYLKAGVDSRTELMVFLYRNQVVNCPCGHQN